MASLLTDEELGTAVRLFHGVKQTFFGNIEKSLTELISRYTPAQIDQINRHYFVQNRQTIYNTLQYSLRDAKLLWLVGLALAPRGDAFAQLLRRFQDNSALFCATVIAMDEVDAH